MLFFLQFFGGFDLTDNISGVPCLAVARVISQHRYSNGNLAEMHISVCQMVLPILTTSALNIQIVLHPITLETS